MSYDSVLTYNPGRLANNSNLNPHHHSLKQNLLFLSPLSALSHSQLSPTLRDRVLSLSESDWAQFAAAWRKSYGIFTQTYNPDTDEWKDIDTHHHDSLILLLKEWSLEGLYNEDEIKELSLIWHFLVPWPDSSEGIHKLGEKFETSTLSNGNQSLLKDLNESGNLGFKRIQSGADFKAYKPNSKVYKGAVEKMGFEMEEVAMVAAHLYDLKAARELGMRTIYVEREGEETMKGEEFENARGWVDMWVSKDEGGMLEVARRFGIP